MIQEIRTYKWKINKFFKVHVRVTHFSTCRTRTCTSKNLFIFHLYVLISCIIETYKLVKLTPQLSYNNPRDSSPDTPLIAHSSYFGRLYTRGLPGLTPTLTSTPPQLSSPRKLKVCRFRLFYFLALFRHLGVPNR